MEEIESFEAPQRYRNLQAESSGTVNSGWFETHDEYYAFSCENEVSSAPCVLADISNTAAAQTGDAAGVADAKPATKKKNIVTSWGLDVTKKRKAEEGTPDKRTAKAIRQGHDASAVRPVKPASALKARTKRSKAAGAEGHREAAKQVVRLSHLKVVKVSLKSKGKSMGAKSCPRRVMPARSTKQLTIPEDVELQTSKRAAAHGKDQEDDKHGSPYKPLVLRVKEFDKTPGRFKRKPDEPPASKPLGITEAKEPQLLTSARYRPSVFKPREVAEAEEMAHMPVFRASTLNPLILSTSGPLGLPKVEKRGPTALRPFNFVTDDRVEARAARLQKQEQGGQQAGERQPVSDTDGHDNGENVPPAKARKSVACHQLGPIAPRSPMLHTKFRAREIKNEEQRYEFHALPAPRYLSVPSLELPRDVPFAPTKPEPFQLATEQRGTRHRTQLDAKLSEEEKAAQRARIPRAHLLPLSTDMPLVPPKPEPRALTVPEPFSLVGEARHHKYEERRRELEEEEAAKRAENLFKAKPVWKGVPFRVHEAGLPLTMAESVTLRTSARAVTREEFNKQMEEKQREAEALAKQAEEEKRLQEEEERRQLRKAAIFRATPMPDLSAPPVVKPPPPPKPLTKPVAPALSRRKRRRVQKDEEAC